jgi:hypothetical protein
MDEMGGLVGILAVIAVIVLIIVYVVLPIIGIILGIGLVLMAAIAAWGFLSGIYVAVRNFSEVIVEAHEKLP